MTASAPWHRILVMLAVLVATGCRRAPAAAGVAIVASIDPLAEFAGRLAGERTVVQVLVPKGVEVHDYEPTPGDLRRLVAARLFVYNGAGLEPWAPSLRAQLPPSVHVVEAAEGLPLAGTEGSVDPHVWLDPLLASQQAERILAALVRVDPAGCSRYQANAASLRADFLALHAAYRQGLARCRRREFITAHAAFGYLARRYGLRMVPISGLAPEAEPSPSRLKAVIQEARRTGIRVIYVEPRGERRPAETVAREIGGRTAILDPLESLPPQARRRGKAYFTVMYANLAQLIQGLDCR
ncbi:MAG: zinc ABC transporter substrate-binding protein [Armatimonadota bacterium]|nr:zinc ABC transporter substrate-binding protein [Armatimonadota bacterium]